MVMRVTQRMLSDRSLTAVQGGLSKMAGVQEQLNTGRKLNRPSDSPADTVTAMRVRSSLADQAQYSRNADDGLAWLSTIDSTIQGMVSQVDRARVLGLQGANSGAMSQTAMEALAIEVDQIRANLLQASNTQYLGRPVFGGTTAGGVAYDTATGLYAGDDGSVVRRVGADSVVRVDSAGPSVFGDDASGNLFQHLQGLSTALRAGNGQQIQDSLGYLATDLTRLSSASASEGARYNRISQAKDLADAAQLQLKTSLSDVEDVDLAKATIDLQVAETSYKAALASTARTVQPSLLDFLR